MLSDDDLKIESKPNRGYKIVDCELRGRNYFQFTVGELATVSPPLRICANGLHFCSGALDCFNYCTELRRPYRYLQVMPMSEVHTRWDKSATLNLLIEKELTAAEWLTQVRKEYQARPASSGDANLLLEMGVTSCDIETMKLALESPTLINKNDSRFHRAAGSAGRVDSMEFLIENGITRRGDALHCGIMNNHLNVAEFILKQGLSQSEKEDALYAAAGVGTIEFVKLFIRHGAVQLNSAAVAAAVGDNAPVLDYLLKNGASASYLTEYTISDQFEVKHNSELLQVATNQKPAPMPASVVSELSFDIDAAMARADSIPHPVMDTS